MEPAGPARVERRLAAILAADVAGYSRLIECDEEGTLGRLRMLRAEVIDPQIAGHRGRIVKTTGDGLLAEFASVVDALRCAAEMQGVLAESNAQFPPDRRIEFRIGINVGDIVVEEGDIFGDGVNVAARLEGLAEPGGICVSARVQEDGAGRLDRAFEDIGDQALKNIARPVRAFRVRSESPLPDPPPLAGEGSARSARVGAAEPPGPPLPDKPSIAVLPFVNITGDPEQEYFADGMVDEIITALSRIRWLFVIAQNSSFSYKGQSPDVKQVGRELGVRYVLEGSVRKAGGRVRITAQLIDTTTGAHLWADRFDGSLDDVFELQDKVASSVAGVIEPALQAAESARSAARPTDDLTAYDLYLRGHALFWSSARHVPEALRLLEKAIERDPRYGPRARLGCSLLSPPLPRRPERGSRGGPPKGYRVRPAGFRSGQRRPGHPGKCGFRAGLFRRGHRRHDGAGRPGFGAQSELRTSLAPQRESEGICRPDGNRHRASRDRSPPQSPRPRRQLARPNRTGAFLQSALR